MVVMVLSPLEEKSTSLWVVQQVEMVVPVVMLFFRLMKGLIRLWIFVTTVTLKQNVVLMADIKVNMEKMLIHSLYQFHQDRKSTRLNSSHVAISYAVFCLKKKNKNTAGV